jgi:Mce-associated membrane protein
VGAPRDLALDGARDEDHSAARMRWLAAAALVLVLVGGLGYVGEQRFQEHQRDVAAAQALAAAEKYVVMLTSVDSNTLDKHVADVLNGSTGEFNANYTKTLGGQHRQHVVKNEVTTHGAVVEAAVKSATTNNVQVLLMVDQSVSSLATPEPQIDHTRIKMTMQKVDGRWLASKVELL